MKNRTKIIICACTACLAVIMAAFTADSLRGIEKTSGNAAAGDLYAGAEWGDTGYVLRELGGKIAVYEAGNPDAPLSITDISVSALRESDRRLLASGLTASGYSEMLQLLEDLGS